MRFVPTLFLREGMIVGRRLYGNNGQLLVAQNTIIKKSYIKKIKKLGLSGVYINDSISEEIQVRDVIRDDLRQGTVVRIKSIFKDLEGSKGVCDKKFKGMNDMLDKIISNILENKNLMVNMIDLKTFDDYTFYHSVNVAILSLVIGAALNLNRRELYKLGIGALLHDIGKVFIKKEILNKNDKLTEDEYEIIKGHSKLGYKYLKENKQVPVASYIGALQHHERFDGKGYPNGSYGKKISLYGRIISIADVYDALTSDRTYRKALLPAEAMEYIMANGGSMFDTDIVKIFIKKVAPYPIGTCVKLSNNMTAIVVENHEDFGLRPTLKIFKDEKDLDIKPFYINLKDDISNQNITIVSVANI